MGRRSVPKAAVRKSSGVWASVVSQRRGRHGAARVGLAGCVRREARGWTPAQRE